MPNKNIIKDKTGKIRLADNASINKPSASIPGVVSNPNNNGSEYLVRVSKPEKMKWGQYMNEILKRDFPDRNVTREYARFRAYKEQLRRYEKIIHPDYNEHKKEYEEEIGYQAANYILYGTGLRIANARKQVMAIPKAKRTPEAIQEAIERAEAFTNLNGLIKEARKQGTTLSATYLNKNGNYDNLTNVTIDELVAMYERGEIAGDEFSRLITEYKETWIPYRDTL